MSRRVSPSKDQVYGLQRVTRIWGVSRATVYRHRHRSEAIERRLCVVGWNSAGWGRCGRRHCRPPGRHGGRCRRGLVGRACTDPSLPLSLWLASSAQYDDGAA